MSDEKAPVPEFCAVNSPSLRCQKIRRAPNDGVLCCVKYSGHVSPCVFELSKTGRLKPKEPPPESIE